MKKVNKKKVVSLVALGFGIYFLNFFLSLIFMRWLWPKIANILFPKLVISGEIAINLPFYDTFWLAIYIGVILTALSGRFIRVDNSIKKKMKANMVEDSAENETDKE
jgi:hypothetical protein